MVIVPTLLSMYVLGWFTMALLLFSSPCLGFHGVLVFSHGHEYVCPYASLTFRY